MHRFRASAPLALAATLLAAPAGALRFTSTLDSIRFEAHPGQIVTRSFQLTLADGEAPTHFRDRTEDWWPSEDGRQSFYRPAGTLPRSCARWVSLDPTETEVGPGGTLEIRVSTAVPEDAAAGGYWCVLTVDQVPDPLQSPSGVGVRFLASVSVGIFVYVPPIERQARILSVSFADDTAEVAVANEGNAPCAVEGRIEFLRPGTTAPAAVANLPRTTLLLAPVGTRRIHVPLPAARALPSGRYLVRVLVDIGLDHFIGVQKQVDLVRRTAGEGADGR